MRSPLRSPLREPITPVIDRADAALPPWRDQDGGGGSPPPAYTPSLDFSDGRNSQYIAALIAEDI